MRKNIKLQWYCRAWILAAFILCGMTGETSAQPSLTLMIDPDRTTLIVGSDPKEIWIQATVQEKDVTLTWEFTGAGAFKEIGMGGIYTLPEQIHTEKAQAVVIAVVTDTKGNLVTQSVVFTLRAPESLSASATPTPEPTVTVTPSPSPTLPPMPTATMTATPLPLATVTPVPTFTATPVPTVTSTPVPTTTPVPTFTATPVPTVTSTPVPTTTPVPTFTATPVPTVTSTPVPTTTPVLTFTATPVPTVTSTPVPTTTPVLTFTATPVPTVTSTPVPTALPTATATVMQKPSTQEKVQARLEQAERYFRRKRYTTPSGKNAFEEYQAALKLDPSNNEAREGLRAILKKYSLWTEREYARGNRRKAKTVLKRYRAVAEYMLTVLQEESLRKDLDALEKRILQPPPPTPTAIPTPLPTVTPTMTPTAMPTATPAPPPCDQLSRRFQQAFDQVNMYGNTYEQLMNYADETVCQHALTVLSNIIEESGQIRRVLDDQAILRQCFSREQTLNVEERIRQIDRLIERRTQERETLLQQCRSQNLQPSERQKRLRVNSCQELETLLSLRFENLKHDLDSHASMCERKTSSVAGLLDNLRELQELRVYIVPGTCFSTEEARKIQAWFPRIEADIQRYEEELLSLQEQCAP